MKYPILKLGDVNAKFVYAEHPSDYEKGSFLYVEKDENYIKIKVDRFSTIPFYYCLYRGELYGATKFNLLIESLPGDYKKQLNIPAAIAFLRTNSMLGEDTLIEGIYRVPYGCELVFDKIKKTIEIKRYWTLPGDITCQPEKQALRNLFEAFDESIGHIANNFNRIGMHLSGGMDSRQILGALLNRQHTNLTVFTYGVPESLDCVIASKLAHKQRLEQHYYKWEGVKLFKQNFELQMHLTDGMQALFHGHGIDIHDKEKDLVDVIIYGHFLDLFIQAHIYDPLFEEADSPITRQKLYEKFDGGPCSVIRGDSLEPVMLNKRYWGVYREKIYSYIDDLDYMLPEKKYDALYLLHHGLRRLIPQVISGSHYLDFRLPGLDREYFEISWGIPGKLKKHRILQEKLLRTKYKNSTKTKIVKDNMDLQYIGNNRVFKLYDDLAHILRHKRIGLLKPYYDSYGRDFVPMANKDLYLWVKEKVENSNIMDFSFINKDFLDYLFRGNGFSPSISLGFYGALTTLVAFIDEYQVEE